MSKQLKINNNSIERIIFIAFTILLLLTLLAFSILTHARVSADDSQSATASVNVSAACTMSSSIPSGSEHTATLTPGTWTGNIGTTNVKAICNDPGGFAIYAIGFSNDTYGNTNLINSTDPTITILTNTNTSGDTSGWSMKLASASSVNVPTIVNGDSYHTVPDTYTRVAYYPSSTMNPSNPSTHDTGSSFTTTYGAYISPTQTPGTYNGKVRYVLAHPNTTANINQMRLYDAVASMVKTTNGEPMTQTLADMQAVITEPTSSNPSEDTSNSGVFLYDADYYGEASDASNQYPIYYYRGILDKTYAATDQYGGIPSTGNSAYYPNYVRLHDPSSDRADTCWRIVRTTGSGGTKMIYNGTWTGSTCANAGNNAAAGNTYYNRGTVDSANLHGTLGFAVYVGYNYNNDYAYNHTEYTEPILNSTLFTNEVPSNMRTEIENWYIAASNLPNYNASNELETSAGWCNDRKTTAVEPTLYNLSVPYGVSDTAIAFGPGIRNSWRNYKISLQCPNITGRDLLTIENSYIDTPLAPLTGDEIALAGHGYYHDSDNPMVPTIYSSNFSRNSYLRSGSVVASLSPDNRAKNGQVAIMSIDGGGCAFSNVVFSPKNIRPSISLTHSTLISSGTGTSTDPWVIEP